MKEIRGFKGFDELLKCMGFQYEIGKTYETDKAVACQTGFHFCEDPFDLFSYYPPAGSRFARVVGSGKIDRHNEDSKVACTKITIGDELTLDEIIAHGKEKILERIDKSKEQTVLDGDWSAATNTGNRSAATNTGDWSAATNTGYRSAATNTGYRSAATNTGNRSAATNTGNQSAASVSGKESVAMAIGYESTAKGALGCWIVLAEWEKCIDGYHIKNVRSGKVDGKKIKADTWYRLINDKFVAQAPAKGD